MVVLPFDHPLRVAEDYAMVDVLSGGRLNLGVGSGYLKHEYAGFGVDPEDKRARFDEALEILLRAWTGERFSYAGRYHQVQDVRLNVAPVQTAAAAGVGGHAAHRRGRPYRRARAARHVHPLRLRGDAREMAAGLGAYRAAFVAAGGRAGDATAPFGLHAFCADTTAEARAEARPAMERYVRTRLYAVQRPFETLVEQDVVAVGDPEEILRVARRYAGGRLHPFPRHRQLRRDPAQAGAPLDGADGQARPSPPSRRALTWPRGSRRPTRSARATTRRWTGSISRSRRSPRISSAPSAIAPSIPPRPPGSSPADLSRQLEIGFPATAPLVLARYARIRAGERLATRFAASGALYYVIRGSGESTQGGDVITWDEADAFCLPGGGETVHAATADSLLYVVTNEPMLAFERLQPPAAGRAPIEAAHFPADEIARQLERIHRMAMTAEMPGKSISFGTAGLEADHVALPSFTFSLNSLSPGEMQRPHQHNAVAVTLIVQGERCYSMIDGQRVAWEPWTVMLTPPAEMHSHHNDGDRPGALPHRPGRRAALPHPHHGLFLLS